MANIVVLFSAVLLVNCVLTHPSVTDDDDLDEIIGGTNVDSGTRPYMAYLEIPVNKGGAKACGGTLISNFHILTAAHCVSPLPRSAVKVLLRVYKVSSPRDDSAIEMFVDPRNIKVHENYQLSRTSIINDIAILKLSQSYTSMPGFNTCYLDDKGRCLKIDYVNFLNSVNIIKPEGSNAWAVGWGLTSGGGQVSPILQEVKVKIVPMSECHVKLNDPYYNTKLCIKAVGGSKLICRGDSGGPLMADNSDTQLGITSYVDTDCTKFGVFTRVSYYTEWIKYNIKKM